MACDWIVLFSSCGNTEARQKRRKNNQKGKEDEEEKREKGKEERRWPIRNKRKGRKRKGNEGRWDSNIAESWGADVPTCRIPSACPEQGGKDVLRGLVSLRKAFVLYKAGELLSVPPCYFRRSSWTLLKQLRDS